MLVNVPVIEAHSFGAIRLIQNYSTIGFNQAAVEGSIIPRASISSSISLIIPLAVSGYTWALGKEWGLLTQCAQGVCEN